MGAELPDNDAGAQHRRDGPPHPGGGRRLSLTDLYPTEVADAVWLAAHYPWLTDASANGAEVPAGPVEETPSADPPKETVHVSPLQEQERTEEAPDHEPSGSSELSVGPRTDDSPAGEQEVQETEEDLAAAASGSDLAGRAPLAQGSVVARLRTDPLSLGRALRALRALVPSAHSEVVDEPQTAERIAVAPHLPPVLAAEPERLRSATLVVDDAPQMALWQPAVRHLRSMLRQYAGLSDVPLMTLDTADATRAVLRSPDSSRAQPPRSLVDPTGRRMVLLVTDGSAPAWRSGAAQRLAAMWGKQQPVAVVQVLPQRLWPSTGLFPVRMRLSAQGPWSGNGQVHWEAAEPLAAPPPPGPGGCVVPVPVLELDARWFGPWARFVAGTDPRWADMPAILASTGALPSHRPSPVSRATAAELVARFRTRASIDAFALATRLAAVQLDLETMTEVKRQIMPRASRAHLAELLISPLVEPLPGCAGSSYVFVDGAREELLASGSRTATERTLRQAAEFLAPHNEAARELLGYLHGSSQAPHREEALTAVESTAENLRFRQAEHAALQAISGAHLHRARRLGEHIGAAPTHAVDAARGDLVPLPAGETLPDDHDSTTNTGGPQVSTVPAPAQSQAQPPPAGGVARPTMPAVWGNMPPRNLVFTGREELLVALEHGLRDGPTAVLPHALHGMGGVGKSQLALEYVYRHAAEYEVVCWIPAERPTQIQQAFVELARRLHLPVSNEAITAVPAVLEALRTGNPYGKWLLVFDNAESPAAVQEYFPSTPEGGPVGSVIVTSRNPQWNTLAHPLEVDVFERQESIQLLRRRNPDLSIEDADMLAAVLGDLPLAVEQASAWRAETGMPPAEYLRVFEEKSAELMAVSPPTQYEKTVATAWNVSLDHVEGKNAGAIQLLQLCAYFAPEPVSRQFFSNAVSEPIAPELDRIFTDPIRLSRAIREISRYSLAKIDHRTNSIQMHRLVQAVLEARMTEEERRTFRHGAHLLLAANAPSDPKEPQNWARFGELAPHVIASRAPLSAHRNVRQMVYNVAEYFFRWGDHVAALEFSSETYESWRRLFGEDDPQTLMLGRHVRFIMWTMGQYPQAAELGQQMLASLEDSGPDLEEEYLRVKGQVSGDRRASGDFRGALEFDQDVYARAVRSYGDEDPETLLHAHNLAVTQRGNGLFREAKALDESSWRAKVQMFGADAPTTLHSEASLILDRQELGEYAESEKACVEAVDAFRGTFGDLHPSTLRAVARLGVAHRKAGHHEAAEANTRVARNALIERYGDRSPDTLQASLNLSIDLRQNGDLPGALKLGERTRTLYSQVFGKDHPHTVAADANLAVTLRLLDRVDEARKLNESVIARFRGPLGDAHPHTLCAAINLANDLFAQGEAAAAFTLDEATMQGITTALGEEHPTVLLLRSNMATDLRALGRTGEAEELHRSAVDAIVAKLGGDHPACADALAWRRANCDIDPMSI
ncbi:FxSxx-COOH system tetratricopeptide repeat protein [Streptomyces sp. NPDC051561]|uniref:FxSxx-COOH system tetratricopeptide repeat protein n=1 Tax=Streptomyces sp. NPDC051561 TaxID=3365658 RepID=UPI0037913B8B